MRRTLSLLLTVTLLFQLAFPALAWAQSGDSYYEVTIDARSLNVRSGPGTDFDIIGSVTQGQVVNGLREDSGWVQVELPTGAIGWVSTRYVTMKEIAAPPPPSQRDETPAAPPPTRTPVQPATGSSGGGSGMGGILKWTTLIGAVALGGLAVNERLQGNDAYDEYEELALAGRDDEAEVKWEETADHDDKAVLYGAVAGGLFGLFLLQQFVFGGGGSDQAALRPPDGSGRLAFDPLNRGFRANLVQIRF